MSGGGTDQWPPVRRGLALLRFFAVALADQGTQDPHAGMHHDQPMQGWQFMQDGAIFLMFNAQGGPRGETEMKAPNWWMGMARHAAGRASLTLNLMLSLIPQPSARIATLRSGQTPKQET